MIETTKNIILASSSPRRKELMEKMQIPFVIKKIPFQEIIPQNIDLFDIPQIIAKEKANCIKLNKNDIVITADTMVFIKNEILGKPQNKEQAKEMLCKLSDNKHIVITGVCIKKLSKEINFKDKSEVYFRKLNDKEIDYYVDNFSPYDKAGSYGAQDWIGLVAIKKIIGSYTNVMGLPTEKFYKIFRLNI